MKTRLLERSAGNLVYARPLKITRTAVTLRRLSNPERVVHYAGCPILVVRFPERDFVDVAQCNDFEREAETLKSQTDLGTGQRPGRKERGI